MVVVEILQCQSDRLVVKTDINIEFTKQVKIFAVMEKFTQKTHMNALESQITKNRQGNIRI